MTNMLTKEVVDSAIKNSDNLEGLLTVIVSSFIGAVLGSFLTKKDETKKGAF